MKMTAKEAKSDGDVRTLEARYIKRIAVPRIKQFWG